MYILKSIENSPPTYTPPPLVVPFILGIVVPFITPPG